LPENGPPRADLPSQILHGAAFGGNKMKLDLKGGIKFHPDFALGLQHHRNFYAQNALCIRIVNTKERFSVEMDFLELRQNRGFP
jgi:hypothetical protein